MTDKQQDRQKEGRPHNKRFGKIGVKVITRTSARPLSVSDNSKRRTVAPQLRQAAGTLAAMRQERLLTKYLKAVEK